MQGIDRLHGRQKVHTGPTPGQLDGVDPAVLGQEHSNLRGKWFGEDDDRQRPLVAITGGVPVAESTHVLTPFVDTSAKQYDRAVSR